MPNEPIISKVNRLNSLFLEIQAYKTAHPDEKLGYYTSSIGSILNAYREGDLSFDETKALLSLTTPPAPVGDCEHAAIFREIVELLYAAGGQFHADSRIRKALDLAILPIAYGAPAAPTPDSTNVSSEEK